MNLGIPVAVSLALFLSPTPALDSGGRPGFRAFQDSDATAVYGGQQSTESLGASTAKREVRAVAPRVRLVLPACQGNELPGSEPLDAFCTETVELCAATPDPEDRLYWIYRGPPGVLNPTPEQWIPAGQACLTPAAAGAQVGVPVVTADDFRRLPLPAGRVHVQPGSGRTLLNVPTNVYVEAGVAEIPTTVLGTAVRVRAIPIEFEWTFGDGHRLRTRDPGAAYPDLRTTHTYATAGSFQVTLTTIYRGEYSVAGGAWQPVDGTASVASPPEPLTVVAARAELVDSTVPAT